jgi:hypothetical protein
MHICEARNDVRHLENSIKVLKKIDFGRRYYKTYEEISGRVRGISEVLQKVSVIHPRRNNADSICLLSREIADTKKWKNIRMYHVGREDGFLGMYLRRYRRKTSKIRARAGRHTNFQKLFIGITRCNTTNYLDTYDLPSSEVSLVDITTRAPVDLTGIEITLYSSELEAFWKDLSGLGEKRQRM